MLGLSCSMWDLVLCSGIEPRPQAFGAQVLATGPPGKSNIYLFICSLSTLSTRMLSAWGWLGHWFLLSCVPRSLNNAWHRTEVNKCLLNEWMPNQYLFPHLDFLLKWRDGSLLVHPMTSLCKVTDLSQFAGTFPGLALKVQCPWSLADRAGWPPKGYDFTSPVIHAVNNSH